MAEITDPKYTDTQRMELRALIRLASEIVAYYWPMRTFVHHNPLHRLEDLPFDEAVRRAERLLGGSGYLSGEVFRDYLRAGRISLRHLDAVLKSHAGPESLRIGNREMSRFEVLRACMTDGVSVPAEDSPPAAVEHHPDGRQILSLAERLASRLQRGRPAETVDQGRGPAAYETLSGWRDRALGAEMVEQIDREMIKWCAAFLDEGHATWPMPERERGFYAAWRCLAQQEWSPCGIEDSKRKIARLPAHPEDAVLDSLEALGIHSEAWQEYLALHLAALPGWAGFIKWRADQSEYAWQLAHPVDLVQYLAVRLWYERELVAQSRREARRIDGDTASVSAPVKASGNSISATAVGGGPLSAAWRLVSLARALGLDASLLMQTGADELLVLLDWLDGFPESAHGPIWLEAFEAGYREELLEKLRPRIRTNGDTAIGESTPPAAGGTEGERSVRPLAQAVFCIDVRSEPLRRHLEAAGDYETFGFAGFFAVFVRHQALGNHHETDQFPVIMKSKNLVREIPRTYQGRNLLRHRHREKMIETGHRLLYDLKENVVTPYVMVESLGWFYSLPFVGKTLWPDRYKKAMEWLRLKLVPPVATTLTVDKLTREEVEEMLAAEQRAVTRRALQEKFGDRNLNLSLERLEYLRLRALDEEAAGEPSPPARSTALSAEEEKAFVEELRSAYGVNQGAAFARMERITRTGFTLSEQVFTVETALRMMGLTRNFARLVLLCGHGSSSENNPFEAALDCGACGGNSGKPNARALAIMANKPAVREQLGRNGIAMPQDTYFLAGQHNTATDEVELFDLEDLPPTHRKDVLQLFRDLETAGARTSQERCGRFPEFVAPPTASRARRQVRRRSADWSQVRPEWGLSGNAAFIAGRRALTRGIDLGGRAFLHSYDYREDPDGRLLEVIMTGPQIVGQWINMEHYFSAVDPEIYGSGSKIYHNIVGRLGIMSGPQSDLRTGLAWQTVMNGSRPYHEAMRMLTLIEAPRSRIDRIIRNQRHLQQLYDNEWLYLIAIDPEERLCYRYLPKGEWKRAEAHCSAGVSVSGMTESHRFPEN